MNTNDTPEPNFPAPLDEFLARHVTVANLSRAKQFERYHAFELHQLRQRRPGATKADAARMVYQRQKSGFADETEWSEFAQAYAAWWASQRDANIRRNQFGGDETSA
ncbi:MAG: hypothetical protein IH623_23305 [Verrucomicrobia bacterium]|nr:hypothetical protein [Verrucomicrobiota bacterium]